ncbi:MAG TPA: nitronate monooxygenase, partial [Gemmataceae bacterium]|nr:nitronate monooxygenase [Gemmataceae bacterium]
AEVLMAISNVLTQLLGVEHPIVLAPMDLVADAQLTLAVSQAGGFGFLGAGYGDVAWLERELAILSRSDARLQQPFGVGFITWSLARQPHLLDRALAAKPRAIWLSFGNPEPFVRSVKDAGALLVCQVQNVQMAIDAVAKGADVVVAQGGEAGGHGISQGSFTLIPAVVDAIGAQVPVLLAGGAADGRGLAAAIMLGALGIAIGTRFYASLEAAGHEKAKQRIVSASGDETARSIIFDVSRQNVWPHPFTGRCLTNRHTERWFGRELELMRREDVIAEFARARQIGDFEIAPVVAGEAVALVRDIPSAQEIVRRTAVEAEGLLGHASQSIATQRPAAA